MITEEIYELAIKKGYKYDPVTGLVYGVRGTVRGIPNSDYGYLKFTITEKRKGYSIFCHIFGFYCVHKFIPSEVHHINDIKNDNRIDNLMASNRTENNSQIIGKGYYYNKKLKKYISQIGVNKKHIYLGRFDTPEEANAAYMEAKRKYHLIGMDNGQELIIKKRKINGYSYHKKLKKYKVRIQKNGIRELVGYFDTEEEAIAAYLKAKNT
jgi:hypothetical protein